MAGGRGAATSAAIEDAALDLALDLGYDNVTVDMICERVGVSQRTFFNHFPAKDEALLGRDKPQLDERAARRFVLADGPLLLDALELVQLPEGEGTPRRMADRMRVVSTSPQLLVRQMERLAAVENEITEVIALRLQHHSPDTPADDIEREASLTTHLLVGVIRWAAMHMEDGSSETAAFAIAVDRARDILRRTVSG